MSNGLQLLEQNKPTLTQLVLVNMPTGTSVEEAQRVALKEISNFEMRLQTNPDLGGCTPLSILLLVKQTIADNLTLSPSAGLVYPIPSKVGNDWVATYNPTANGLLSIAYETGSILDNKRPVATFDENGQTDTVTVEFLVPSGNSTRWEVITFNKMHFKKWMDAAIKKNLGKCPANYTSWNGGIDFEFAGTKAIKHGLNKRGTNSNSSRKSPENSPIKYEPIESVMKEAMSEIPITESVVLESTQYNVTTHEIVTVNPNDL